MWSTQAGPVPAQCEVHELGCKAHSHTRGEVVPYVSCQVCLEARPPHNTLVRKPQSTLIPPSLHPAPPTMMVTYPFSAVPTGAMGYDMYGG